MPKAILVAVTLMAAQQAFPPGAGQQPQIQQDQAQLKVSSSVSGQVHL